MKVAEFPTDLAGQNTRANEIVREMIKKVLGREEAFKVSVRRGANVLRKARDSTLLLLPPLEVRLYTCEECLNL
jgi:hypothetical protein